MPISLRMRKRRDGSVCLANPEGRAGGEGAAFPDEFLFSFRWLATAGQGTVRIEGQNLSVTFANAQATYRITETDARGFSATLVESDMFDPPPVDEDRAVEVARTVRRGRIEELARAANIDPATAEQVLLAQGAIVAADQVTAGSPRDGEV